MVSISWCMLALMIVGANAGWTPWLDRDDPSATGDWETVGSFSPKPCNGLATKIQARMRGDSAVIVSANERISVGPNYGLVCKKADQPDNTCLDYVVHYLMPRMSKKFDRDDPSVTGDWEVKSLETGSDWKNGEFIYWYANDGNYGLVHERLEIGPRYGLVCKRADQPNNACRDYQVRFYCPTLLLQSVKSALG